MVFERIIRLNDPFPDDVFVEDGTCPLCGSPVIWDAACPGAHDIDLICNPPCGEANEFRCLNPECDWWYRYPNFRSDTKIMGVVPSWFEQWSQSMYHFLLDAGDDGLVTGGMEFLDDEV